MDDRTFIRRCAIVAFTVLAAALVAAIGWNISPILGVCSGIISKLLYYVSPLIYAFIIAYLLFIPVEKIESLMKKNQRIARANPKRLRIVSILITFFTAIALIVIMIASIYIMIGGELSNNVTLKNILEYISNYLASFKFSQLNFIADYDIRQLVGSVERWIHDYLSTNMSNLAETLGGIGSAVIVGLISLIISIYFLMDYESLGNRIKEIYFASAGKTLPGRGVYHTASIFSGTFKQFLKGQLTEACIVAALSVIALMIVGVDYYGIIGVIAGICNLIPMVGPWIGALIAVIVSILGGGYMTAVWAVVAMLVVQQIDNSLVAPKIVGDSVGLHPVVTMIVLIIGADVGGVAGMLLAVPVAATVKNICDYVMEHKEELSDTIKNELHDDDEDEPETIEVVGEVIDTGTAEEE